MTPQELRDIDHNSTLQNLSKLELDIELKRKFSDINLEIDPKLSMGSGPVLSKMNSNYGLMSNKEFKKL